MFNDEYDTMYRYTVSGILTPGDYKQHTVYFEGVDDDGSPILSLYKSNAYFFNMRKDAVFIANAVNAYHGVATFRPKLFTFREYRND